MKRILITLLAVLSPAVVNAANLTVCASGCGYTNAQLQDALWAATCGDQVLLQQGQTYSLSGSFVLTSRCTSGTWDRIIVRTGVSSTGSLLSDSLFPAANVRMTTSYRSVLAKLIPAVNNEPAIRTVWPAETGHGCAAAPCLGNGWTLKWLEFGPKSDWLKGKLVLFGSNKGLDPDLPAGDTQNTVAEAPQYLTLTQCDLHGDPDAGQHGGLYLSSQDTRVTHNSFTDFKSLSETQAITEINGVGPFLIENNLIEATGENIMFGGGDSQLQQNTTITGSPTSSSITLTGTTDLFSGQFITVTHAGTQYSGLVCTLTGSVCALAPALPVTPSAGDTVKWTRIAGGATIRLNAFTRPVTWRNDIVPAPTGVSVSCFTTGGTLSAGTYWYRVSGLRNMGGDGDAESAASAQVSGSVASGTTGRCVIAFTESIANTSGSYIFGRTSASQDKRWSVANGVSSYTDTGTAGTADTPLDNGNIYVVKNAFELKHLDGGSPAGANLIEGNIIGPSWCCSQNMAVNFKSWNQNDGLGDVSSTVRNITFRYNWIRHMVRGMNITATDAEGHPSGTASDIVIEHNLWTDMSTAWGGSLSPIQLSSGNYANHVGSRGCIRCRIEHNTFLPDNSLDRPMDLILDASTDTLTDLIMRNNLHGMQGGTGIRADIAGVGLYNTAGWNASVAGSSAASFNVWADGVSGDYTWSTSSFFPSDTTLHAALVSYVNCYNDIITGCALNGSSAYDNAGSDSLDIGANVPLIKTYTDIALSGDDNTPAPGGGVGRPRTRLRLRGNGLP